MLHEKFADIVDIRCLPRGRKRDTLIEGLQLPNIKEFVTIVKKKFGVIGYIKKDEKTGKDIVGFSGDLRDKIKVILTKDYGIKDIIIH